MARILIKDLSVETKYGVQVRSQRDGHVSEWSNYLEVITVKDIIAPADPTDLTFVVVNSAFVANWTPPTLNMDGSDLNGDLKDYVVTIIATNPLNPAQTMTRVYYTEKPSFELTAADNTATFFEFQSALAIRVQSRDFKNNVSTPGAQAVAAKAKPNPVTNLTAGVKGTSFVASWTPPTQNTDGTDFDDFKNYNVVVTDGAYSQTLTTTDPSFTLTFDQVKAMFGQMKYSLTFKVSVVNQIGAESTQVNVSATKPPPPPVTNLTWVVSGDSLVASWTPPANMDDVVGYKVTTTANGITLSETVSVPDSLWTLTAEKNKANFFTGIGVRTPTPSVTLKVETLDSLGQTSTAVTKPAPALVVPATPTGVSISAGPGSEILTITWNAVPGATRYEVYTSTTSGGTVTYQGSLSASAQLLSVSFPSVSYGQNLYGAVKAFNVFDTPSAIGYSSASVSPASPFTINTNPPGAVTGLTATTPTNRNGTTQPAAISLAWVKPSEDIVAGKGDLAGYQFRFAEVNASGDTTTPRVWQYHDVVGGDTLTTTLEPLRSDKWYTIQMRAFDTMFNVNPWPSDTTGIYGFSSNSAVPYSDIKSNISILTGGSLRSSNYVANTSGWLLSEAGLDIQNGLINAAVVRTGALKSNITITDPLKGVVGQPLWTLNTDGNMSINDAQVRGKIVVGSATDPAATNTAVSVASWNYGGSGAQWAIKGDGTMEFRSAGPTANRIEFDGAGYRAYTGATPTVIIRSDGTQHQFAGNLSGSSISNNGGTFSVDTAGYLTAKSGLIGGWSIGTTSLTSAGLRLDSTNGMIDAGSAGTRIGMKAGVGFWAGSDNLNSASPFFVSTSGALYTQSATITGTLSSSNGLFSVDSSGNGKLNGNFEVKGHLEIGNAAYGVDSYAIVRRPSNGAWIMLDGRASTDTAIASSSGYFSVNYDGVLTATQANISGAITATSGSFTGNIYANGGYFKGDITGAYGSFSGSLSAGISISSPTITGGTIQNGNSGTWIRMIESDKDALQFMNNGSVSAEIRGTMGSTGGRGIYLNVDTQIGNTQSIIYQVGRRKGQGGAPSATRVRGGSFNITCTGGAGTISWDGMDVVPNCVQVTLTSYGTYAYSHWISNIGTSGCTLNVRYSADGAVPGQGNVSGYYYVESFV